MLQRFQNFISKNGLFNKSEPLLLALSGGADSVCLFHLLIESGYHFSVAHCNFQLRGEESNEEEKFVKALAKSKGIKCYVKKFDTKAISKIDGRGIQELARELRYTWFNSILVEKKYTYILTAHHQTDNLETILINILRGTGVKGLHGIPINDANTIRPLMYAKRIDILDYLNSKSLDYREDSSNASNNYLRNQIRHFVLPELLKIQPEAEQRFFETSQKVKKYELMAEGLMAAKWKEMTLIMDGNLKIDLQQLSKVNKQEVFLFHNVRSCGFTQNQIEDLLQASQIGKKIISNKYALIKEREYLKLVLLESIHETMVNLLELKNQIFKINGQSIEIHILNKNVKPDYTQKDTLYINADKLSLPLKLRIWMDGDRIRPLGMNGYKKISDILTDKKVENNRRNTYIVLQQYENELVALLPLVVSENYKIDETTNTILSIRLNMA